MILGHNLTIPAIAPVFQVCTARPDLGNDHRKEKPQTNKVKGRSRTSDSGDLSLRKGPLRRKYLRCDEPSCEREYYNRIDLANHKRKVHGANEQEKEPGPLKRKYECDEPGCGRECTNLTDFDNHKRRDHGAEKLKCQDSNCAALFVRRIALSHHMWVKHGIGKGPKCEECGKREPTVDYLKNHQRAVHGAPKLQCKVPGCTKTFIYNNYVSQHMQKKHR